MKKFTFILFFLFLFSNIFWLFLAYNNKIFPYYELGYLYRKIDREYKKISKGEDKFVSDEINKNYDNQNNLSSKIQSLKLDTALLPIEINTFQINDKVKFAQKGGAIYPTDSGLLILDRLGNFFLFDFSKIIKLNIDLNNNLKRFIKEYSGKNIKFTPDSLRAHSVAYDKKNKFIYVAYTKYIKNNITNLTVSRFKFDLTLNKNLSDWEDIFQTENLYEQANSSQDAGGKIFLDNLNLYLTVGYSNQKIVNGKSIYTALDLKSYTGKIIKINIETRKVEIISKGHRNAQGLTIISDGTIISTEHGPQGGDEVNVIKKNGNYGYPIKSFGTGYGTYKSASVNEKIDQDNLIDPIFFFTPSIGISSIIESKDFHEKWNKNLLIGSLKSRTLYRATYLNKTIKSVEPIWIGSRIRDMTIYNNKIILLTDNSEVKVLSVDEKQLKEENRYNSLGAGGLFVSLDSSVKKCVQCHSFSESNPTSFAPSLNRVFNRKIATDNYNKYSKSLISKREQNIYWNEKNLSAFLIDPQKFALGSAKLKLGLSNDEIKKIIQILKKQSLNND